MKKSRLLEIIREEITTALTEVDVDKARGTVVLPKASNPNDIKKLTVQGIDVELKEEDQLNEMAYDIIISQPNELAKLQDKIKDSTKKGEQKLAKALEIIQKTKKEGKPIRQRDIANEMGVIQQEINPLINKLIDVGILEKGESVTGVTKKKVTDKAQGRPASEEPKAKAEKAPKAKVATRTPGDDGFDDVSYSEEDDEVAAATKAISGDETAKELGKVASRKDKIVKAYRDLEPQVKDKIAKAKEGDKEATDWLKNTWTPILKAYNKAQQVNA